MNFPQLAKPYLSASATHSAIRRRGREGEWAAKYFSQLDVKGDRSLGEARFGRERGNEQGNAQILERNGAPGRTRTCDPRLRRPMLYPPELRARVVTIFIV